MENMEWLKLYLDNMDKTTKERIHDLKTDISKVHNIENDIIEIKRDIKEIREDISAINTNMVSKKDCEASRENCVVNIEMKKKDHTTKRIATFTGIFGVGLAGLIELTRMIVKVIVK